MLSRFLVVPFRRAEAYVTPSTDGLQCADELGSWDHAKAMKREHDTEPGSPDLSAETGAPSESRPRQITARGLGAPPSSVSEAAMNDSVDFTSETDVAAAHHAKAPAFVNDSMDAALDAIGNRRRRMPVSLEEGRSEHSPPRSLPSGNDTLPTIGKVVVDAPTDPGERQPLRSDEVTAPPQERDQSRTLRRAIFAIVAAALVVALVFIVLRAGTTSETRLVPTSSAIAPSSVATSSTRPELPTPAPIALPSMTGSSEPTAIPSSRDPQPQSTKPPPRQQRDKENARPTPDDKSSSPPSSNDVERIKPY